MNLEFLLPRIGVIICGCLWVASVIYIVAFLIACHIRNKALEDYKYPADTSTR